MRLLRAWWGRKVADLRRRLAPPLPQGAAQVRRLVDRDRKELNLDELEATFAEDPAVAPSSAAAADASSSGVKPAAAAPEPTPKSPFQVNSTPAGAGMLIAR